jgi:PPOX class probable FMN-dependent enzyme
MPGHRARASMAQERSARSEEVEVTSATWTKAAGPGFGRLVETEEELAALYGPPSEAIGRKAIDRLDRHCRGFIARSPLVFVATADRAGRCDVSPRGGPAGFVAVLDERRLLIPDAPGNRRIDSIRNVFETGEAGLLFLVPGIGETLRANGSAVLVADQGLLSRHALGGRAPRVAIGVSVREAFLHCAKALKRSALWEPDRWPSAEGLAPAARILADHIALGDVTADRVQRFLDEDYACNLY